MNMLPLRSSGLPQRTHTPSLTNSGDILFSTVSGCSFHQPFNSSAFAVRSTQSSSVQSLVDPNIELPTISANEVDEVLNQLTSPPYFNKGSSQTLRSRSPFPGGSQARKNGILRFSKDDSFTPPPIKRPFAIIGSWSPAGQRSLPPPSIRRLVTMSDSNNNNNSKMSPLIAALQLPHVTASSQQSPNLHAALRCDRASLQLKPKHQPHSQFLMSQPPPQSLPNHELPKTFIKLVNSAAKQRQENFTVRLANKAKLITSTTNPSTVAKQQSLDKVDSSAATTEIVSNDHLSQDPNDRFRFVCPHPRCGRRYQARLGLTWHLVKYHGESVENQAGGFEGNGFCKGMVNGIHDDEVNDQIDAASIISKPTQAVTASLASASPIQLCIPVRAINVERSSHSWDRSKQRCLSPSSSHGATRCSMITPFFSVSSSSLYPPQLLNTTQPQRSHTSLGDRPSSGKMAIVSLHTSSPPMRPLQEPPRHFNMYTRDVATALVINDVSQAEDGVSIEFPCNSTTYSSPLLVTARPSLSSCSASAIMPQYSREDDAYSTTTTDQSVGESSSFSLGGCCPTDSLPCLRNRVRGTPPLSPHSFSPPPFIGLSPSRSCVDCPRAFFTIEGGDGECYNPPSDDNYYDNDDEDDCEDRLRCYRGGAVSDNFDDCQSWTDSAFSSSLVRHQSEYEEKRSWNRLAVSPGPWCGAPSHAPVRTRMPYTSGRHQRKQRFSVISSDSIRRYSARRRRTVSSGMPASLDTTRSASVICDAPVRCCGSRLPNENISHDRPRSKHNHRSTVSQDAIFSDKTAADSNPDNGLVTCPVHDCRLVCSGCESLCEHLKECHLPDSRKKPVRLIYACPVKDCGTFCADEAAFEAHFDAHLNNQTSGDFNDLFRRRAGTTLPQKSVSPSPQRCQPHKRTNKSASLVDLTDVFDQLLDTQRMPTDIQPPSFLEDVENNPRSVLLELDNSGLLQALDLLPDDLLHDLLQESRTSSGAVGNFGNCASGTPTLSNSSLDEVVAKDKRRRHQTPMAISSTSASSGDDKKEVVCDCGGWCSCEHHQQCSSSPLATPVHHRLSCGKRQRNSLASLLNPSSSSPPIGDGTSIRCSNQLLRAHSSVLPTNSSSAPYAQPSASQLLFSKNSPIKTFVHPASSENLISDFLDIQQLRSPITSNVSKHGSGEYRNGGENALPLCHLSDTEMSPAPPFASSCTYHPYYSSTRIVNRLKRRR